MFFVGSVADTRRKFGKSVAERVPLAMLTGVGPSFPLAEAPRNSGGSSAFLQAAVLEAAFIEPALFEAAFLKRAFSRHLSRGSLSLGCLPRGRPETELFDVYHNLHDALDFGHSDVENPVTVANLYQNLHDVLDFVHSGVQNLVTVIRQL